MASIEKSHSGNAYVVMGVCGVGKTSVGVMLAKKIGARYIEADEYHPDTNVDAMKRGVPLTDEMRLPWLVGLSQAVEEARTSGDVVVACSALKRSYRDVINQYVGKTKIVFLTGDRNLIASRLAERTDHFMSPTLLDSQLDTLEVPTTNENVLEIDIAGSRDDVLGRITAALPT